MNDIKFNSSKIEKAINNIKNNSIIKYADKINADLLAIETSLNGICPIPFEWRTIDDLILSWKKTLYDRFRLHITWKDAITSELQTKTLIETKIDIRIKAYPHLEDFLVALNENNQKYYSTIMKDYKEME